MNYWQIAELGICVPLLLLFSGCSGGSQSVSVSGRITYEGQPVEMGTIVFVPLKGTAGQSVSADIKEGRYAVPSEGHLVPDGSYRVEVIGQRKTGRTLPRPVGLMNLPTSDAGQTYEELEEFIPAQYNARSTLIVTLSDSELDQEQNFDLQ